MDRGPVPVAVAILLDRGRVFLLRRPRSKPLAGHWEFPGGKVEVGESPEDALRRELREELGLTVSRLSLFAANAHVYELRSGRVEYVLLAYRAAARDGPWSRRGRWMNARELTEAPIVAGSLPFVDQLRKEGLVR